ncbi:MAG: type II toxin-antitoxin system death-on-curing family toxin [Gudongella sp.]|nr:type II toxin-antitoxin system death-on-curing family toxin [Gudongella sp.]
MIRLTKNQVINMHSHLIVQTGGSFGIRDEGLLTSAVNAPYQTFDGIDLYETIQEKASKLCYFIISNHPFTDGNKRIGVLSMLVFLEINGVKLICTNEDLIRLGLGLADGSINDEDLLRWILENSK